MIDSKPRNFSYLQHKQNFPIQLKGNMKRRCRPQSTKSSQTNNINSLNVTQDLATKIKQNYQDLKSVLPYDLNQPKKTSSKRTYNNQPYIQASGVTYLMIKSRIQKDHPQKRHLNQWGYCNNFPNEVTYKQKRHYCPNYIYKSNQQIQIPHKKHSQTLNRRLNDDIYSRIQIKQNQVSKNVRMNDRNMFLQGSDLGYQKKQQPRISCAKRRQLMGSVHRPEKENYRRFRNDWGRSTIHFG